ncbi:hypothetical protein HIMB114_00000740 [alpha proteobacterium HIMB114]|nr:hypothetical protein HIMB114_00000740 [alpha proteobacterium HIMB114]
MKIVNYFFLVIIVFLLNACDQLETQSFKPNQEINFEKLVKFNPNKYKFKDYKKVIGNKDVTSWDGSKGKSYKNTRDWKKINVTYKGKDAELIFFQNSDNSTSISLNFKKNVKCSDHKNLIPNKYIKPENTQNYIADMYFVKMPIFQSSYDFENKRINVYCLGGLSGKNDDKTAGTGFFSISIKNKDISKKVVALKQIECTFSHYKSLNKRENYNKNYRFLYKGTQLNKLTRSSPQFFHIDETDKKLYNERYSTVGKIETFNENIIISIRRLKKNKSYKSTLLKKIKLDRRTGEIIMNKELYDPKDKFYKDKILRVEYIGECKKRTSAQKF